MGGWVGEFLLSTSRSLILQLNADTEGLGFFCLLLEGRNNYNNKGGGSGFGVDVLGKCYPCRLSFS